MNKIPSLFLRDEITRKITKVINPLCQWVADGEGVATRKYDGTSCWIDDDGSFWKRCTVKPDRQPPEDFIFCEEDPVTRKVFGWTRVSAINPQDKYHMEALENTKSELPAGYYELLGPKVQGNPEHCSEHVLLSIANADILEDAPRNFNDLRAFLLPLDIEGIVFHHEDGRMSKVKKRDFNLKRVQVVQTSEKS